VGKCSGSYLCEELELEFDCETCGCPQGLLCMDDECITEERRLQRLIVELQKSDVLVENDLGTGSGIIIKERWVLTARHVVDPEFTGIAAANIEIFNSEREIGKPQSILLAPNAIDLAVIVINKDMGPPAKMVFNESIERGAEVLAIGSPLGIQDSVTKGIISNLYDAKTESEYGYEAIQIDAPVNPGNSGGGLFLASNGKLIGVTTSKRVISEVELAEGLGFAVPIDLIEEFPVDDWQSISAG
jgi:S1-C subfamily serine protease